MTIEFIHRDGSGRLLLIFAGWAMDARPFAALSREGYDIAVAYDYRDYTHAPLTDYDEICVVAWSFGVAAAADFMAANPALPFTLRLAVNGTLTPVDDHTGIPRAIFDATLAALSERSLLKFYRRMCGSAALFARFSESLPERPVAELADELRAIAARPSAGRDTSLFDRAVIGSADAIIPPGNQRRAWSQIPAAVIADTPHLPDFQKLIDRHLTDKQLVGDRFSRSMTTYDANASIQQQMASRLARSLPAMSGADILEIGTGTGCFTRLALSRTGGADANRWELWDLTPIDPGLPGRHRRCDAEQAIHHVPDRSYDAIVSAATVQWFNSPARFVAEAYRVLRPGGIIAISTFGPRNFEELHPYIGAPRYLSAAQWAGALAAAGIEAEIEEAATQLEFADAKDLLRHLQLTGVNASASSCAGNRAAREIVRDNIRTLTYAPLYILIRKQ